MFIILLNKIFILHSKSYNIFQISSTTIENIKSLKNQ